MTLSAHHPETDAIDPIDIAEELAEHHAWEFDRTSDKLIMMLVAGICGEYPITIAWSQSDETLRLMCHIPMKVSKRRLTSLFRLMNLINGESWVGSFCYWEDQSILAYRYGLTLAGDNFANTGQVGAMINNCIQIMDQYYTAVQSVIGTKETPEEAFAMAIGKTYGRA